MNMETNSVINKAIIISDSCPSTASFNQKDSISDLHIEDFLNKNDNPTECNIYSDSNKFINQMNHNEQIEDDDNQSNSTNSPKLTENDFEINSCSSMDSLNQPNQKNIDELKDMIESEKFFGECSPLEKKITNTHIKRTNLKRLIYEMYETEESVQSCNKNTINSCVPEVLIEGLIEKLPPGKTTKNSILLTWKKRYFKLNSIGLLNIYENNTDCENNLVEPIEIFNLMGARVNYEQNGVISLNDGRGNSAVFRCFGDHTGIFYKDLKSAIDKQIIDRSESLWVKPNVPLTLNKRNEKKVLIIDIGTCSFRAGFYNNEPKLPEIFMPTVCARDFSEIGKLRVGFEAFESHLASSAPSTIDLNKAQSMWSLCSTSSESSNHLMFPLKNKKAIDKLSIDVVSIDAIISYVVDTLSIDCEDHQIVVITPQKLSDKVNSQFLNLLLENKKYKFQAATIVNQALMALYSYNSTVGVIVNLGEKIDIIPICNGIPFQNGITNLTYGGNNMSEYLNSFISRGHQSYVNEMEQYFVRYVKEKSCYSALNYKDEQKKFSNYSSKYKLEINDFNKVEFPETARFNSVEGLFNPEIWGIDGKGIHKLIHKAIQSSSMDLRREMAQSIYLCGGMSRIPGLQARLEQEMKQLLPPTLTVKVNCSKYSYHSAFLGAHRFIQQQEYEKLLISAEEWSNNNVSCLKKWRMI